jgi:hypothetical protein
LETRNPRPIGASASWLNAKDGSDEWSRIPCTQEGFSGKSILFWSSVAPPVSPSSPSNDANGCTMCWWPTNNVRLIYALFYGDLNTTEPLSIFWFLHCVMNFIFIVAFVSSIDPGSESITSYLPPGTTNAERGYFEFRFNAKLQFNEYVQSIYFITHQYMSPYSPYGPFCLLFYLRSVGLPSSQILERVGYTNLKEQWCYCRVYLFKSLCWWHLYRA